MKNNYVSFSYKAGNSFVHKMPVIIKILLIPALNILFFMLPFYFSAVLLVIQFIIACKLRFSLREQFTDFKPVIYYAILLYFTGFIAQTFSIYFANHIEENISFIEALKAGFTKTFTNSSTAIMLLKLFCIMQSASIIFKTSTSLQIREGVGTIETAIRKILPVSKKNRFTTAVSLFVCFIPMVYKNWQQCKRAWFARGGKKSIKMYLTIFPVFFSVGIKQAWNSSRAILIRE